MEVFQSPPLMVVVVSFVSRTPPPLLLERRVVPDCCCWTSREISIDTGFCEEEDKVPGPEVLFFATPELLSLEESRFFARLPLRAVV